MADSPGGGILVAGAGELGDVLEPGAESLQPALPAEVTGGVGDSPVRGTLVTDGPVLAEAEGEVPAAGGVQRPGPLRGLLAPGAGEAPGGLQEADGGGLVRGPSRDAKLLQKRDDLIRRRNEEIVADSSLGPRYDPTKEKPEGMSERRWRTIKASWANMKAAPTWLTMAYRIVDSYQKSDAVRGGAPTINGSLIQVNVTQTNVYPVRRVRDD